MSRFTWYLLTQGGLTQIYSKFIQITDTLFNPVFFTLHMELKLPLNINDKKRQVVNQHGFAELIYCEIQTGRM